MTYQQLRQAVLALPIEKRFRLYEELADSLDHADVLSEEWKAEIERRWAEIESGKAKLLSAAEVKRRLEKLKHTVKAKR